MLKHTIMFVAVAGLVFALGVPAQAGWIQTVAGTYDYLNTANWAGSTIDDDFPSSLTLTGNQIVEFTADHSTTGDWNFNHSGNYNVSLRPNPTGAQRTITLNGGINMTSGSDPKTTTYVQIGGNNNPLTLDLNGATREFNIGGDRTLLLMYGNNVTDNTGGVKKTGTGTLEWQIKPGWSGQLTVEEGLWTTGQQFDQALPGGGTTVTLGGSGTTGTLENTRSWGPTINNPIVLASGGTGRYSGTVAAITTPFTGLFSGSGNLGKIGPGGMTLSNANTFTGDTLVSEGTLNLNNVNALQNSTLDVSGAGTVAFIIAPPKTYNLGGLKGTGSINAGTNTLNVASVSPGNSAGLLTVNNALDISGIVDTGDLYFDLGSNLTPGTTYDHVSMDGQTLTLGTLNFADFTFATETGFGAGSYTLFDASGINGGLGTTTGVIGGFDATLSIVSGDVLLNVTAPGVVIPEPATMCALGLAVAGLGGYVRKRRRC